MAKKVRVTEEQGLKEIEQVLNEIEAEEIDTEAEAIKEIEQLIEEQPTITVDMTHLMAKLPDSVTTKNLVELFHLDSNEGGKYIRRHIRKKFIVGGIRKATEASSASYAWKRSDPQLVEIVTYFAGLLLKA